MNAWDGWRMAIALFLLATGWSIAALGHEPAGDGRLPSIGPAPAFTLTTQDGRRLSLDDLHGKVVAITFIYTSCADTCRLLTATMARLQGRLGPDFGPKVFFVSITADPERDTPEILKHYAEAHGANQAGWAFLTGTATEIREVAKRYGIYYKKTPRGDVDHTYLTSLVDQTGTLRVQYMGVRLLPVDGADPVHGVAPRVRRHAAAGWPSRKYRL